MKVKLLFLAVFWGLASCFGDESSYANPPTINLQRTGATEDKQQKGTIPKGLEGIWDSARYISVSEVKPGMEAYCLTVYQGTEPEKFRLDVVSVVPDFLPARSIILVRGTDERFIHSGPVAGCSGSPVYIEGRLAGALALGWTFSKDPLYGVTPIEDMLKAGMADSKSTGASAMNGLTIDFSGPVNLDEVQRKIENTPLTAQNQLGGATLLPSPLIVSGLPDSARSDLESWAGTSGLMVVSGGAGGGSKEDINTPAATSIVPGGCLTVPVVTGDITMEVVGTATEVRGNDVYGFGHSFLGYGAVDLPMAAGQVHTVVSTLIRSFKIATATNIVGTLTTDEATAVRGKIGTQARMIPLTMRISRYNDTQLRTYHCEVADNQTLTPRILRSVISGGVLLRGDLPPDNTLVYKGNIKIEGSDEQITFGNISTGSGTAELTRDSTSPVALLMNNPYRKTLIKSVEVDVRVRDKNISAELWSVSLSKSRLKAGESFDVKAVIETYLAEKKEFNFNFTIPENTPAGNYQLIVAGGPAYEEYLQKAAPYKFETENFNTLVKAINELLSIKRDELHCILVLPAGGIVLEKAELPDLPATKALVLADPKRAITTQTYPASIDKKIKTDSVVGDQKVMTITVER